MKRIALVFMAALLSLACACGKTAGNAAPGATDTPQIVTASADQAASDQAVPNTTVPKATTEVTDAPAETVEPEAVITPDKPVISEPTGTETKSSPVVVDIPAETVPPAEETGGTGTDAKATAMNYIGQPVSALFAAIGCPASSDYAPSCLGDGEDGNLYYDGFMVYTHKDGGSETINYVE